MPLAWAYHSVPLERTEGDRSPQRTHCTTLLLQPAACCSDQLPVARFRSSASVPLLSARVALTVRGLALLDAAMPPVQLYAVGGAALALFVVASLAEPPHSPPARRTGLPAPSAGDPPTSRTPDAIVPQQRQATATGVAVALDGAATAPLPHFWQQSVGSGHALLGLRADWRAQLAAVHRDLGVVGVRFHGTFDDDMGPVVGGSLAAPLYNWTLIDQVRPPASCLSVGRTACPRAECRGTKGRGRVLTHPPVTHLSPVAHRRIATPLHLLPASLQITIRPASITAI